MIMKKVRIKYETIKAPLAWSMKNYLWQWRRYLRAFLPDQTSDFPQWQSEIREKKYIHEGEEGFEDCALFVVRYEGAHGTVDLYQP